MSRLATRTTMERIGWVPLACVIATIALVSIANLTWLTSPYFGRNDHFVAKSRDSVGVVPPRSTAAGSFYRSLLDPNRVEIPKLRAAAPIVPVATDPDGELQVPANPKVVGWWSPGAKPGAKKGTAIFAGHINYAGVAGTLASIGTLKPGNRVVVFGKHGGHKTRVDFRVTGVRTYHKTHLPYQRIFDQGVAGRLAVVTCGGPFDASTGNYLDNIVVFAVPIASSKI